jgi:8-oxo-dGTP pyrophosphatase MutT (NUDIX family)
LPPDGSCCLWSRVDDGYTGSMKKRATIVFCVRDGEVLLGLKKVRFGAGKWNGYGGKVDAGETVAEAAARELFEESGLAVSADSLSKVAVFDFYFADTHIFECHAFIAHTWQGEPEEREEMMPRWFAYGEIPYGDMWEDDQYWLPRVLAGEKLEGTVIFDQYGKKIVSMDLRPVTANT